MASLDLEVDASRCLLYKEDVSLIFETSMRLFKKIFISVTVEDYCKHQLIWCVLIC